MVRRNTKVGLKDSHRLLDVGDAASEVPFVIAVGVPVDANKHRPSFAGSECHGCLT